METTDSAVDYRDFSRTGPGTLAGRYLRTFWWPVSRSQDLPRGRAVPIRILGEDRTLYRGEDGSAHVVAFRCAHRGTQLSTGWVEGDQIRCFYHGWKYGPDGRCTEQPAEPEPFCERIRIPSYPVREYLGLVFAFFGEGEPPALPRYPFMEAYDESDGIRMVHTDLRPFNYRNRIENSVDPAHVAFVHRNSEYRGLSGPPSVTAEETDYGMILRASRPSGAVRVTQYQMPTTLCIKQGMRYPQETGWRDFINWRVPVDDESNRLFSVTLIHVTGEDARRLVEEEESRMANDPAPELGEEALAGRLHVDDVTDLAVAVNFQDYVAQKGQGVVADREERLGRADVGVILLRQLFAREMRALAEGRPLKRWTDLTPLVTIGERPGD